MMQVALGSGMSALTLRPQTYKPALAKTGIASASPPLFSGNGQKAVSVGSMLTLLLGMFGIQSPATASNTSGTTDAGNVTAEAPAIVKPFVDGKRDLPASYDPTLHPILDVANNPMLTSETKTAVMEFIKANGNHTLLMAIPDTHMEMDNLCQVLGKELGLENTRQILLVLNQGALKGERPGDNVGLFVGDDVIKLSAQKAQEILRETALPALKAGDTDKAVKDTLKALQEARTLTNGETIALIGLAVLLILLYAVAAYHNPWLLFFMMGNGGGGGGGGFSAGG